MATSVSFASMSDAWRLLVDAPAAGAWNMAVDEILLEGVAAGAAPPTLRFYEWMPPCLSLGYFQPFDVVDTDGCRRLGVGVIRRPTGGRAILHDRELTYSVALPASLLGHDGGVLPSYYRLSLALQDGLRRLGVPATLAPESGASGPPVHGPVCFDPPSAPPCRRGAPPRAAPPPPPPPPPPPRPPRRCTGPSASIAPRPTRFSSG